MKKKQTKKKAVFEAIKKVATKKATKKVVAKKAAAKKVATRERPGKNDKLVKVPDASPVYLRHTLTARTLTILYSLAGNNKTLSFSSGQDAYTEGKKHLSEFAEHKDKAKLGAALLTLIPSEKVKAMSGGRIELKDGRYILNGVPVPPELHTALADRIKTGSSTDAFEKFWERLNKNPGARAKEQFFKFVQSRGVTLLPDGRVVLYKGIKADMTSLHDGKTLHTVGEYTSMPRSKVVDDSSQCAAQGLHCAPWDYVKNHFSGGNTFVELYVDPEDIVSVPHDGHTKLRVWRYYVNGVVNRDGQGIRKGFSAAIDERPVSVSSDEDGVPDREAAPVPVNRKAARRQAIALEEQKRAGKPSSGGIPRGPVRMDNSPTEDFFAITGDYMTAAGFMPRAGAMLVLGKRSLYILSDSSERVLKKHRLQDLEDMRDVKISAAGILKIRRTAMSDAQIKTKKARVVCHAEGVIEVTPVE